MNKPTLQNIIKLYGEEFRWENKLPYESHKVLNAIESCKTEKLGYHLIQCEESSCDYEKVAYNSCRNRHCPACQSYQSAKWVMAREVELLPVPYFHVVYTVPHELNPIFYWNKEHMYNLLFKSAWESLSVLVNDDKHFGGQGGAVAVLHTWGQNLFEHPHIHMIVPGGALKQGEKWIQKNLKRKKNGKKKKEFLVPIGPLKILFKNKFLSGLAKLFNKGELILPEKIGKFTMPNDFFTLKDEVYRKNWNINIKEPFAGPKEVLKYLGRYTHRIAISNSRILDLEGGRVKFLMKDYRNGGKKILCDLDAQEFIKRFLLHVLPKGFRKIRMFGFLANRYKFSNLEAIRKNLKVVPAKIVKVAKNSYEIMNEFFGVNILKCPKCGMDTLRVNHNPYRLVLGKGFG